jgi:hypothetical protein
MASPSEHTHHINVRSTQMEMPSRDGDYDQQLLAAKEEVDRIQLQRDEVARKKAELEAFTERKRSFLSQQAELSEKLTSSLTLTDRALFEMRQETADLEQCRVCFAAHLDKLQKFNPEAWSHDQLPEKLDKALMVIDIATDEYDQAAAHFQNGRSGVIFGSPSKRTRAAAARSVSSSEFTTNLRNGFAFNLPMIALGGLALLVYLLK